MVEWLGILSGVLLMGYGIALAKIDRYEDVDDWFATGFSTVGFVLILVATNYVIPLYLLSLSLRAVGYLVAAGVGTYAFIALTRSPPRPGQI